MPPRRSLPCSRRWTSRSTTTAIPRSRWWSRRPTPSACTPSWLRSPRTSTAGSPRSLSARGRHTVLRDVVAGFLDTVTEREFDAPLIALLAARGFRDVHFLHGAFEFGKDVIAKGPKPPGGDTGTGDPASWA